MKFNLPKEEIEVDAKQQRVHLPLKRFAELMDYVEDIESKLLASEINLREADRLTSDMEKLTMGKAPGESLSSETVQSVERALNELPAQIIGMIASKGLSIRKLAMMTSIPYTTLHRYVTRGCRPSLQHAAEIIKVVYPGGSTSAVSLGGKYAHMTPFRRAREKIKS